MAIRYDSRELSAPFACSANKVVSSENVTEYWFIRSTSGMLCSTFAPSPVSFWTTSSTAARISSRVLLSGNSDYHAMLRSRILGRSGPRQGTGETCVSRPSGPARRRSARRRSSTLRAIGPTSSVNPLSLHTRLQRRHHTPDEPLRHFGDGRASGFSICTGAGRGSAWSRGPASFGVAAAGCGYFTGPGSRSSRTRDRERRRRPCATPCLRRTLAGGSSAGRSQEL